MNSPTPTPTPRTAVDILRAARELIAEPEKWTQGAYARDIEGLSTNESSRRAVCFCSSGAVYRVGGRDLRRLDAISLLRRAMGGDIVQFNDSHTHAEVLGRWDTAIILAEQSVQS